MEPNGDKRRGFAVGDPARRSRDGTAKGRCGVAKPWPRSGRPPRECAAKCRARFCAATPKGGADDRRAVSRSEMRPNGSKGRGESGSRVWEKRKAPRCRGDDYESPTAYFLSIKKVGKER